MVHKYTGKKRDQDDLDLDKSSGSTSGSEDTGLLTKNMLYIYPSPFTGASLHLLIACKLQKKKKKKYAIMPLMSMNFYRSVASNNSSRTASDQIPARLITLRRQWPYKQPITHLPCMGEIKRGEIRRGIWIGQGPIPIIFSLFYSVTVSFEELLYILWYLLTPVLAEWPVCCTVWAKLNIFYIIWVLTQKSSVKLGKKKIKILQVCCTKRAKLNIFYMISVLTLVGFQYTI